MTPDRARAYGRVVKTVSELGTSKLLPAERDRIRTAADLLVFAHDLERDVEARDAPLGVRHGRPARRPPVRVRTLARAREPRRLKFSSTRT